MHSENRVKVDWCENKDRRGGKVVDCRSLLTLVDCRSLLNLVSCRQEKRKCCRFVDGDLANSKWY